MKFTIHYKEKLYLTVMAIISLMLYGSCFFLVYAMENAKVITYVYIMLFFCILKVLGSVLLIGMLRGNSIKINKTQFPDIYDILTGHSMKLGLKKIPNVYVMQGNGILNAFVTKFASRNYVVLYSDVLELAYKEGIEAVSFIIGHELGHIKRSHTSFFKSIVLLPAKFFIPFLGNAYSRACEYTCDNIGYNLCPQGAIKGILILAVGKELYKKINVEQLLLNAKNELQIFTDFAEIFSTHPMLIRRIEVLNKLNYDNLEVNVDPFISPKVTIEEKQIH